LTDPDYSAGDDNSASAEHKDMAVKLCVVLCELFGESLDRMTLWDRIASALATAAAKTNDGDTDRFISIALDHVRADAGKASRNEVLPMMLYDMAEKPAAWRQGFVRYVASHSFAILAHGRLKWEHVKAARKEGAN
jgi:hypothetical protein